jgi:WD40 repeat protein
MDNPEWKFSLDSTQIILVHSDLYGAQQAYVNIISLIDGKVICTIYAPIIRNAWLSNNGAILAAANDSSVDIYDVKTKKVVSTLPVVSGKEISSVDDSGNLLYAQKKPDLQPIGVLSGPSFEDIRNLKFKESSNNLQFESLNQNCILNNNAPVECVPMEGFLANDGNYYTAEANSQTITLYRIDNGNKQEVSSMSWNYVSFNDITSTRLIGYSAGKDFLVLSMTIGQKSISNHLNMKTQNSEQWDWYSSYVSYAKCPRWEISSLRISGNNEQRTEIIGLKVFLILKVVGLSGVVEIQIPT